MRPAHLAGRWHKTLSPVDATKIPRDDVRLATALTWKKAGPP
jgi:hypothetical protein